MDPEVRGEIRQRALRAGASVARTTEGEIELDGSVLVASGLRP
jgi:hypothetical protein